MKRSKKTVLMCVVLSILVIVSFAYLFSALKPFIIKDHKPVIELVPNKDSIQNNGSSSQIDKNQWQEDTFNKNEEETNIHSYQNYEEEYLIYPDPITPTGDELLVYDDDQIWTTSTDIDIFKLKADEVNIVSLNNDKIIAPGSENEYSFYVKNNGAMLLRYDIEFLSYFDDNTTYIPVDIKLKKDGDYILGDDANYVHVKQLDKLSDNGILATNNVSNYELMWKWSFEGDDLLDTSLGDRALDEDVTLTIQINTVAEAEYEEPAPIIGHRPGKGPGVNTGDEFNLILYVTVFLTSLVLLIILLKKKDEDEDNTTNS